MIRAIALLCMGFFSVAQASEGALICFDRFSDQVLELTGDRQSDPAVCRAMVIAGTVGVCFSGDQKAVIGEMNQGAFEYSPYQKVIKGTVKALDSDIIGYSSYEGDFVGWTRPDVEVFRCPESGLKQKLTSMARALDSSVDYAVSRVYREKFGLPEWLK